MAHNVKDVSIVHVATHKCRMKQNVLKINQDSSYQAPDACVKEGVLFYFPLYIKGINIVI